jgi:hypothetical protein
VTATVELGVPDDVVVPFGEGPRPSPCTPGLLDVDFTVSEPPELVDSCICLPIGICAGVDQGNLSAVAITDREPAS